MFVSLVTKTHSLLVSGNECKGHPHLSLTWRQRSSVHGLGWSEMSIRAYFNMVTLKGWGCVTRPKQNWDFFLFCLPACQSCRGWLMIINHPPAKKNSNSDSTKAFCHLNSSSLAISLWVLCGIAHYSQVRLDVWKLIFRYFMQLLFLWHSLRFTRQVKVWLHHHPMAAVSPDGQCVTFESGWCQFG